MGAVVAVHGGAGRLSRRAEQRKEKVLREIKAAMEEAMKTLKGGSALDAVVEAVSYMEECGEFNAGKGSVMTMAGTIELDAGVMWGRDLTVGAVGALKGAWNAIRVARAVMERTDHILLVGEGADRLARLLGLEGHPGPTKRREEQFHRLRASFREYWRRNREIARSLGYETVGAVALDRDGNLAAAASTGGIWFKLPGRLGDTPLPGAGFYAANGLAAASASGRGEYIARFLLTARVVWLVERGFGAPGAVKRAVDAMTSLFGPNTAGVVAVDSKGCVGMAANTEVFIRGVYVEGERPKVAFLASEGLKSL